MAALSETERWRVWAYTMRHYGPTGALTKVDLRDAVDALDDWIEANQSTINQAIPQPARAELNLQQKTLLFCWVAMRRAGILRTQED